MLSSVQVRHGRWEQAGLSGILIDEGATEAVENRVSIAYL